MPEAAATGKIERKFMAHFINAGTSDLPAYERLGKDLEEYSPEMSAQVDKKKNILGETSVVISSYEKTGTVEPYYAEKGSKLFDKLQKIVDENLVLDALKTDVVEAHLWESDSAGAYPAVKETAYIEITRYGGDATGYQIAFNLHYTGEKTPGKFNPSSKSFEAGGLPA